MMHSLSEVQKSKRSNRNGDVWLDTVGVSHLKKLGWIQSKETKLFGLKGKKVSVKLSRERLVEIISRSKDRLKSTVKESNVQIVGRIEEEILIDKIQRYIDIETMVKNSGHSFEIVEEREQSSLKEATSPIVPAKSKAALLRAQPAFASPIKRTSSLAASTSASATKPTEHKIYEKCKYFPKYLADSYELLFTEETIEELSGMCKMCKITVSDSTEDDKAVAIRFRGFESYVNDAMFALVKRAHLIIAEYNSKILLDEPDTIEIDIKMNVNQSLGFKSKKGKQCLWVHTITNGGQLQRIIGVAANGGAVITYMGLLQHRKVEPVRCNNEKKAIIKKAKMAFETSKDEDHQWILIRICLAKDENLGGIDMTKIVNIRRRDGSTYRGRFQAQFHSNDTTGTRSNRESRTNSNLERGNSPKIPTKKRPLSAKTSLKESERPLAKKSKELSPQQRTNKDRSFRHFSEKTKDVKDIEYKSKKVHTQAANGSMWSQHKKEFGEHCDSECLCMEHLSDLTKNVVEDFVSSRQNKDPKWKAHSDIYVPIGFVDSFCPKFYPRVQKEFPKDSPEQLLAKLVNMWRNGHQIQRAFHLKCSKLCSCLGAWEEVFLPICKGGSVKKAGTKSSISKVKRGATSMQAKFDIIFKPQNSSLGLFCENEIVIDGVGRCVVTSVDPRQKSVSHVPCGTVIDSYQIGNEPAKKVTSCQQIERIYDELKPRDMPLTLRFVPPKVEVKNDCSTHWSRLNNWIGPSSHQGWAGGAMISHASKLSTSAAKPGYTQKYLPGGERHNQTHLPERAKILCRKKQKQKKQNTRKSFQKPQVQGQSGHMSHPVRNMEQPKALSGRKLLQHCHQSLKPHIQDSNRSLSSTTNNVQTHGEIGRGEAMQPQKVLKPAPKILRAKGSSSSGAKVKFDESKNTLQYIDFCRDRGSKPAVFRDKIEKLTENVLSKTLEDVASALKHIIPKLESEKPFEKPLDLLKARNKILNEEKKYINQEDITHAEKEERIKEIQHECYENDLKRKLLKVYARPHNFLSIVGNTTPLKLESKDINFLDHIISEQQNFKDEMRRQFDDGARFYEETVHVGRDLDFDIMNIHVLDVSFLHAAAFAADEEIVMKLIEKQAQITKCDVLGTALDVATYMHAEAQKSAKLDWAKRYLKIVSMLETYLLSRKR